MLTENQKKELNEMKQKQEQKKIEEAKKMIEFNEEWNYHAHKCLEISSKISEMKKEKEKTGKISVHNQEMCDLIMEEVNQIADLAIRQNKFLGCSDVVINKILEGGKTNG